MISTLQNLVSSLELRYPNELPHKDVTIEELRYLQGNKEVVDFVLQFLEYNAEEIERNDILGNS